MRAFRQGYPRTSVASRLGKNSKKLAGWVGAHRRVDGVRRKLRTTSTRQARCKMGPGRTELDVDSSSTMSILIGCKELAGLDYVRSLPGADGVEHRNSGCPEPV
jgi:hypothetical protein